MRKLACFLVVALMAVTSGLARAEDIDLSSTLHKTFKEQAFPHNYRSVGIKIVTKADYLAGNRESADFERARKVHKLLIGEYKKAGWKEDKLAVDDIVSKDVELAIDEGLSLNFEQTLRMKAYLQQCSAPMRKYRGGNIGEFFAKEVVAESEYCVTYDNVLEQ
jgi:hypothetical protein